MTRICEGLRVVVVGGFYHGRRGVTLSSVDSAFDKIQVRLDTSSDGSPSEPVWLAAYLLERADWRDGPMSPGVPSGYEL